MIWIGIDDTDVLDSPGTNQMARAIVAALADQATCRFVLRHQLLDDPRVPYTSKNGSASISLVGHAPVTRETVAATAATCEAVMRERFVHGSDPGLCVALAVPAAVQQFGQQCQREVVDQRAARDLAREHGLFLTGLGGTEGGVIGALAAVGLAATQNDGRIVVQGTFDELTGSVTVDELRHREIVVEDVETGQTLTSGCIDLVKKLRPNVRGGRIVLYVQPARPAGQSGPEWVAVKRP